MRSRKKEESKPIERHITLSEQFHVLMSNSNLHTKQIIQLQREVKELKKG